MSRGGCVSNLGVPHGGSLAVFRPDCHQFVQVETEISGRSWSAFVVDEGLRVRWLTQSRAFVRCPPRIPPDPKASCLSIRRNPSEPRGHRGRQREAPRLLASEGSHQRGGASFLSSKITLESDKPCIRGPNRWRRTGRRECPLASGQDNSPGCRSRTGQPRGVPV